MNKESQCLNVTFSEDNKYSFEKDIEKSIEEVQENRIFEEAFGQLGEVRLY